MDKSMTIGRTGMFNIIKERWAVWNIKEDGNLPNNLLKRGVDDVDALPNYHYRDDAVLLWAAIRRYVTTVVEGVYGESHLEAFIRRLYPKIVSIYTDISSHSCNDTTMLVNQKGCILGAKANLQCNYEFIH